MKDIERKFLLTVERGDLAALKALLKANERRLDINCCDPLARNALIIAINNENLEMVKVLIEAGIRIGDALLYAIDESFVEAVDLLLEHEESLRKASDCGATSAGWEREQEHSFFSSDMTPLILASHRNNFEIIKMLLDRRVSLIPDPHDPSCDCKACCSARAEDCLKHSSSRINAYRALASPCLIALSSVDPLLTAFEMSAKLERLANLEPEYKSDYLRLRGQCQTFATDLLDHARTSKELETLLNYSDDYVEDFNQFNEENESFCAKSVFEMSIRVPSCEPAGFGELGPASGQAYPNHSCANTSVAGSTACSDRRFITSKCHRSKRASSVLSLDSVTGRHECYKSHMRLARLKLAIKCGQKTFCAHPNIQELLANMWYENLPGFRRRNALAQAIQVVFIGLMFPLFSIAYLVAPHSQLGRYIKKPFIKFICHSASYITFLLVLLLASQRVEAFYSWSGILSLFSPAPYSNVYSASASASAAFLRDSFGQSVPALQSASALPTTKASTLSLLDQAGVRVAILNQASRGSGRAGESAPPQSQARSLDSLFQFFVQVPASSKKRGALPSPIELVILIWVFSLIWAELKQLKALGFNYYRADMWNILDSVASGFYVGAIILRIISYVHSDEDSIQVVRERWQAYDSTLLSEGLFAAATIFSSLKLIYIFSLNPYLGPLQISLSRMILDIIKFSWIYMLVLFSFACGMNQLLWYYADLERHQCMNVTNYMLAQYYSQQLQAVTGANPSRLAGVRPATAAAAAAAAQTSFNQTGSPYAPYNQTNSSAFAGSFADEFLNQSVYPATPATRTTRATILNLSDEKLMDLAYIASLEDDSSKPPVTLDASCKTWRHFSNVFESSQTLFWATFGLVDLENFDLTGIKEYTRFWALLMFGCYCFINVIVVLNLLIAMMNHSYVKISKRSDVEWKFARTKLWMSYFDTGSTVSPPFNIIPSVKWITNLFLAIFYRAPRRLYLALAAKRSAMFANARSQQPKVSIGFKAAHSSGGEMRGGHCRIGAQKEKTESMRRREKMIRFNNNLTANYRSVMRCIVRRYLVNEQRLLEKKRNLTEAKLNRWAKLNAFDC